MSIHQEVIVQQFWKMQHKELSFLEPENGYIGSDKGMSFQYHQLLKGKSVWIAN
jgi:hypothetical protein